MASALRTPDDRVQDECLPLARVELTGWWRAIDEIVEAEARKPWGEQRLSAGVRRLRHLEPARADAVFVDLLEKGSPKTRATTSWSLVIEPPRRRSEQVFRALVKLTGATEPDGTIRDHDSQRAAGWAWTRLTKSVDASSVAVSFVLDALRNAEYCYNTAAYEAAHTIDTAEARAVLQELRTKVLSGALHDCSCDLSDDPDACASPPEGGPGRDVPGLEYKGGLLVSKPPRGGPSRALTNPGGAWTGSLALHGRMPGGLDRFEAQAPPLRRAVPYSRTRGYAISRTAPP